MAFLKKLGNALKAPLKPINKAVGKVPGMGAVQKKTPGLGAVGGKLGLGPTPPVGEAAGPIYGNQAPPPPQPMQQPINLQQGPINRMQPALQNAGQMVGQAFGRQLPMRPQLSPMQPPPEMPDQGQENPPDMMALKAQQMQQMQPQMNMGMRPQVMPRFGMMGGGRMNQMPMPDEGMDAQRQDRFRQMRQGGIGPRMGGGGPQQY
jgi:hypothetical protein